MKENRSVGSLFANKEKCGTVFCKRLMPFFMFCLLSLFFFVGIFGCAAPIKESKPLLEPVSDRFYQEQHLNATGSLWQDDAPLSALFADHKARRVGDVVTISIVEASSASNQATTKTGRKSAVSGGLENFFNMEKRYPSSHPFFNPFSSVKGGLDSTFDGSGNTTRSGKLTAYITARVTEVLANGNLKIVGSREVSVNNEKQYIVLSGVIRPRDISPDNIILSTYISDAKISYSGSGIIDERQSPGWLARILDSVWPF